MTEARNSSSSRTRGAPRIGTIARDWWRALNGQAGGTVDRGALAELRRCRNPVEVISVPAFHELYRRVREGGHYLSNDQLDRLAAAAAVLAHVREDTRDRQFARALGPGRASTDIDEEDQAARMSYRRFRRLLQCQRADELLREMRRAVVMLDRAADVADFAAGMIFWGDAVRQRWAFQYYGAEPPASARRSVDIRQAPTDQPAEEQSP